uniref:GIY-YIG endonuclease n=1 Tax=Xylaria hypoxylon TaxID=37992 RepID=A0A6G6D9I9_9PEZI|nr:GIY-YIG endonuclease [Xylaria hypoxylon]QIE13211.1 GIY-YIG endonuclease [Xylaria hypoxylon]
MINLNNIKLKPVVLYSNCLEDKNRIFSDNKGKAAIYRWINKINSKTYVGSSVNLAARFYLYYSLKQLNSQKTAIHNALLKYGHKNFKLEILEYCVEGANPVEREQYFLDILKPEYNICKIANSPLGVKRNKMFSIKLSKTRRGKKIRKSSLNSVSAVRFHTYETKAKMSLRNPGVNVKIFDKLGNLINEFPTIKSTAEYIGVCSKTISRIYETGISYDEFIYKFEIKDLKISVYDNNNKLINILNHKSDTSIAYNIPYTTLSRYIKSGKLYKKRYYFYHVKSNVNKENDSECVPISPD